jgi:hypothetical protein
MERNGGMRYFPQTYFPLVLSEKVPVFFIRCYQSFSFHGYFSPTLVAQLDEVVRSHLSHLLEPALEVLKKERCVDFFDVHDVERFVGMFFICVSAL